MEIIIVILIFVIVFLLTRDGKKRKSSEKPKTLWQELNQSPEFQNMKKLHDTMKDLSVDGTDKDVIPDGYGEFGYSPTNPIPVNTVLGNTAYLSRLQTLKGEKVEYERAGSTQSPNVNGMIDIYEIYVNNQKITTLYLAPYNKNNSAKAPDGFSLISIPGVDNNKNIIKQTSSSERVAKIFADEIISLIDIQMQQEPFSKGMADFAMYRAKSSLAILNCAYFIFFINSFSNGNDDSTKIIIDKMYDDFFTKFKEKYKQTIIRFSEIIVDENEQIEILKIANDWGINYDSGVSTLLHNLFPFIYENRIPKYLSAIGSGMEKAENDIVMPFSDLFNLFSNQFIGQQNSEYATILELNINSVTLNKILKTVQNNL